MKKLTIEHCQNIAKAKGFLLISTVYKGTQEKLTWQCVDCGAIFYSLLHNVRTGLCKKCGTKKGADTRRKKGTDKIGARKAIETQRKNGTLKSRAKKIARIRKDNGTYITGAKKGVKTRLLNGTDNATLIAEGKFTPYLRGKSGKWLNASTHEKEHYHSTYELKFMLKMNSKYSQYTKNHGIIISYVYKNKKRSYIPDFLINNKCLIEIKPRVFVNNPQNIAKFQAAELYCQQNNLEFKVLTEYELGIK